MIHAAGLIQAILDDPDSDELRQIYADWLEERGDPRGEFVRVQVELASLPETDPRRKDLEKRETTLHDEHGLRWLAELKPDIDLEHCSVVFQRGFVDDVTFWGEAGADHLIEHGAALFRRTTLTHLRLLPTGSSRPRLFPWDQPKFDIDHLRGQQLDVILELLPVDRLRLLDLGGSTMPMPGGGPEVSVSNRIGDRGVERIALCSNLRCLGALLLSDNLIADRGALALAKAPFLPRLRQLDLRFNQISDAVERELRARCAIVDV